MYKEKEARNAYYRDYYKKHPAAHEKHKATCREYSRKKREELRASKPKQESKKILFKDMTIEQKREYKKQANIKYKNKKHGVVENFIKEPEPPLSSIRYKDMTIEQKREYKRLAGIKSREKKKEHATNPI